MTHGATWTFQVTGMYCGSCGLLIDEAVEDLAGVDASHTRLTSLTTGTTTVRAAPGTAAPADVAEAIRRLGYQVELTS